MVAMAGEATGSSPTKTSPSFTMGIGQCPVDDTDTQTDRESLVSPIALIGTLASSAAASLTGAAVDSAVKYLTQERIGSTSGYLSADAAQLNLLFNGNGQNCLYTYLYTQKLWEYFNQGKQVPSEGVQPVSLPLKITDLRNIEGQGLTSFLSIVSFVPANPGQRSMLNSAGEGPKATYYKPYIWKLIYHDFVDTSCPAFRNCKKRDVAMSLVLKFPTAPEPDKTSNKAVPFGHIFQRSETNSIASSLSARYGQWFALDESLPNLANIEFSLVETSKPGAVANAIAESLKTNKEAIVKIVVP